MISGEIIRLCRKKRKLTMRALAERAGVTAQMISNYEKGRAEPMLSTFCRLLEVMDFDVEVVEDMEGYVSNGGTAVVNGQLVRDVAVNDMHFLGSRTKRKLYRCDIFSLSDFVNAAGEAAYAIAGFFVKKGERLGAVELSQLVHLTYHAVWERVDGKPFVPLEDYRKSLISAVAYDYGFLWKAESSLTGLPLLPEVDPAYGLSREDISALIDEASDVRSRCVLEATRRFFDLPEIREAYRLHIVDLVKAHCTVSFHGDGGVFTYEEIRNSSRANYEGKKKRILDILFEMVEEGDLSCEESSSAWPTGYIFRPDGSLRRELLDKQQQIYI